MFTTLGVLVLGYVIWAWWRGEVYAKSGWRWACLFRDETPVHFWFTLACYTALGIAMLTVF